MPSTAAPAGPRRPGTRHLLALLLTPFMPGLGHLLAGWVARGIAVWSAVLAVGTAAVLAFTVFFPPLHLVLVGATAAWVVLVGALWRDLERLGPAPEGPPAPWLVPLYVLSVGALPVLAGAHLVRAHLVDSAEVQDASMVPGLLQGDRVLFDRRAHHRRRPRAGDLVVADLPERPNTIARVVAVGGQAVQIQGGLPVVDGQPLPRGPVGSLRLPALEGEEAEALGRLSGCLEGPPARPWVVAWVAGVGPPDPEPVHLRADELYVVGDQRTEALAHGAFGRVRLDQVRGVPRRIWASTDAEGGLRAGRGGLPVR